MLASVLGNGEEESKRERYALRGPAIVPVIFVNGFSASVTFTFGHPTAFATKSNTLLTVAFVSCLPKLPNPQFACTVLSAE